MDSACCCQLQIERFVAIVDLTCDGLLNACFCSLETEHSWQLELVTLPQSQSDMLTAGRRTTVSFAGA